MGRGGGEEGMNGRKGRRDEWVEVRRRDEWEKERVEEE